MARRLDPGPLGTGPLTKLDERVLQQLRSDRGQRAVTVARKVHIRDGEDWNGWRPAPSARQLAHVRAILRGFEHLGRVSGRGGWWRAL